MTSTENQQEQVPPTKEQIIEFLKEQIEVKELQARVSLLNSQLAINRASELEALAKIAHYSKPSQDDVIKHQVTDQDLVNNPSLVDQNVKAGDTIGIPKEALGEFVFEDKGEA